MCDQIKISDMDQEMLQILFEEGGFFIFLDVPVGTEFGVDMKVWNTDEKFKGIKMIPPGIHFIHYSSVDNCDETGQRSGFFHNFKKRELLVKRWDEKTEDISPIPVSDEEIKRLKDNIKNWDRYLGCYPYDIYPKWISLSSHLNDNLIQKLSPACGIIRAAVEYIACKDAERPRGTSDPIEPSTSKSHSPLCNKKIGSSTKDHLLPELKPVEGTGIQFTKFPEKHYPDGSLPGEITQHSLDYSYLLQCMLDKHDNILDFLGEIQFAYICFLIGGSLDAFEQWKELVGLICSCQKAITKHRILYDNLPEMFEIQLSEIPGDFLVDIVANNNFIYIKLKSLFRYVADSEVDGRLKTKISRFKEKIAEKYNWDLNNVESETDDEAPVVVELSPEELSCLS